MPTPAKPSSKQAVTKPRLEPIFDSLDELMKRHSPPFRTDVPCMAGGKSSFQLAVPKPVVVSGAYAGKPVDLQMAAANSVGFYLV